MTARSARVAFALGAVLSLSGCDQLAQVLSIFGFGPPPPQEVLDALPIPSDAKITSADCAGAPHTQGFTCVVHAESLLAMERGADVAAHVMSAWKEYSWDWVPGRIQSSWTRSSETVSIAVHERGHGSTWSLTYTWGTFPEPLSQGPYRNVAPQADARIPETLASLPVPKDAKLLQASSVPGRPNAQAIFSVEGDPAAILAPFETMDGWQKSLRARAPWANAAGNRHDEKEVVATVWVGKDGKHTLVLVSQPAG
jgi:hypothetical protein